MTPTPAQPRLLSIEDDQLVRSSIVAWLGDSGYEMLEAVDGPSGLDTFLAERPDLVLLDMGLPGMPGMDVLRAIVERSPQTPVVIVSANAAIADAIWAFKAGAWDYVTKPILSFDVLEQTIRNCLERRALREKIRQAEERYGALIQGVPVIVFSMGEGETLDFINKTCLEVTGYSPEEALAEKDWLFRHAHPDDRGRLREALTAARADREKGFRVDFRFEHRRGYTLHLHARSLEHDMGDTATLGGVIDDNTETVFLEKMLVQREKLNTLGAVSSELAHEIRNPLMSLGGFARRLARSNPELEEAAIILEQAERLEELMNRITAYVAPVPVASQRANLTALLTFCLDRLAPTLMRRNLDIRPRLDLSLRDVLTDPDLLTDTLVNILGHVTDVMTAQGTLVITTRELAGHVRVDFDLTDPAAELPTNEADHLLMPFEEGGRTLGLALAHRNMKNMGGHLVLSHRAGGITVTASLPLAEDVPPEPATF